MLLTNNSFAKSILNPTAAARLAQYKQKSVNARALGILVRDTELDKRIPHYIMPANMQLPASVSQIYGTVRQNQQRVRLRIVESGTAADSSFVELGICQIEPLPENLPAETEIEVTITYDEQSRVHVAAKVLATGQSAHTEIIRPENILVSALNEENEADEVNVKSAPSMNVNRTQDGSSYALAESLPSKPVKPNLTAKPVIGSKTSGQPKTVPSKLSHLEESNRPIPLCNTCGEPIDARGKCERCETTSRSAKGGGKALKAKMKTPPAPSKPTQPPPIKGKSPETSTSRDPEDSEFWKTLGQ
jgi:molecular chaperone DnaK